jgi:hypothetical protein
MPTRIYTLTPAQLVTLRAELTALGTLLPSGNSGTFKPPQHPEVTLGVSYDGVSKLTVTVNDDAWYETAGEVFNALDKYMPAGSLPTS